LQLINVKGAKSGILIGCLTPACAVEGNAEYIIIGDEDLLALQAFEGIQIITPRDFLKQEGRSF
jgi:predicted nucleic acid-binding protein